MSARQTAAKSGFKTENTPVKELDLFDANARVGPWMSPGPRSISTAAGLIQEMDYAGIQEAMVYHSYSLYLSLMEGNRQLTSDIEGRGRLHPVWLVAPDTTGEMPPPKELAELMLKSGARMGRMIFGGPSAYAPYFSVLLYEELLAAFADRRIPVMIEYLTPISEPTETDWENMSRACREFPDLPLILTGTKLSVQARIIYRFFEKFPNFYLESSGYQVHQGIEDVCKRFGAGRLLFGTCLPYFNGGQSVTHLLWADIENSDRKLIAGGNLRRLLKGIEK